LEGAKIGNQRPSRNGNFMKFPEGKSDKKMTYELAA
jgi:hypothetical protein